MLPFIIGGVALATIGYGVKKYFDEEGYPWDDSSSSYNEQDSNSYDTLYTFRNTKQKIQNILLQETKAFLEEFKNLPVQENIEETNGTYYFEMSDSNIVMLDKFNITLLKAQDLLNSYLDTFETFTFSSNDYEKLNDEEKVKLDKAIALNFAIKEACVVALSLDSETISKMAKRCFKRLEAFMENKE